MIIAYGLDWETATLAERESCAKRAGDENAALARAVQIDGINGCVLIKTCNRFEWYADIEQSASAQDVASSLASTTGIDADAPSHFLVEGEAAVQRLMEIASGIRSQILGEDQIISQVRDAQKKARAVRTMTPALETLFRLAVTAGKTVRTKARLRSVPASSAQKAVELASEKLGGLKGRKALVIGNGQMGRLAADLLVQEGARTTVTLRSYRHGETTIPAGCAAIPYEERASIIEGCDVIVSATKSPHYTVTADMLDRALKRPSVIVDIAVPRDVEASCGNFEDVELIDMDDLKDNSFAADDPQLALARSIIERYERDFSDWQKNRALRLAGKAARKRIAVFAETAEGRMLCDRLFAAGVEAKVFSAPLGGHRSLGDAGDPEASERPLGQENLEQALRSFNVAIDAVSPLDEQAHRDIAAAASISGTRLIVLEGSGTHDKETSIDKACRMLGATCEHPLPANKPAVASTESTRFPLFVNLADRPCVVIGGGPVGVRRARALARFGASVTLIAPDVCEEVEDVLAIEREYRSGDVRSAFAVVAATNDRAVNHEIAAECAREGIPVNVSDCPEECSFFFPALCESENLVAGVVSRSGLHELTARAAQAIRETLREVDQ